MWKKHLNASYAQPSPGSESATFALVTPEEPNNNK